MLPKEYTNYLKSKVADYRKQSWIETVAVYALNDLTPSIKGGESISIYLIAEEDYSLYQVKYSKIDSTASKTPKFRIVSAETHPHNLQEFWTQDTNAELRNKCGIFFCQDGKYLKFDDSSFDDYVPSTFLRSLEESIGRIDDNSSSCAYIIDFPKGKGYAKDLALLYLFQQKFAKVVPVPSQLLQEQKKYSIFKQTIIPSIAYTSRVTIAPSMLLIDLILAKTDNLPLIAVPLTDEVLNSECVCNIKWRDIIPASTQPDILIDDIPVVNVFAHADSDGYQNIFLSVMRFNDDKTLIWRNLIYSHIAVSGYPKASIRPAPDTVSAVQKTNTQKRTSINNDIELYDEFNVEDYTHIVLDTGALLDYPDLLTKLTKATLVIPLSVYSEINKQKDNRTSAAHSTAQLVYQSICKSMTASDNVMILSVEKEDRLALPPDFLFNKCPDDIIIAAAIKLNRQGKRVCVITSDKGMYLTCRSLSGDNKINSFLLSEVKRHI